MRNQLIIIGVVASMFASPAFAKERASTEETVGFGVGAAIGAVAGGPVGLIIGAAIGSKLGDEFDAKGSEIASLNGSLQESSKEVAGLEKEVASLNKDIDSLGSDIQRLQSMSRPELINLLQAGIEMDLLFRTDEFTLASNTDMRMQQLAASLATMQDVYVQLDGFADERGNEIYNQELSEKRVQFVKDLLVQNGVPESRISVAAHGESAAADATVDSFALERKVSLTLYVEGANSFASTP